MKQFQLFQKFQWSQWSGKFQPFKPLKTFKLFLRLKTFDGSPFNVSGKASVAIGIEKLSFQSVMAVESEGPSIEVEQIEQSRSLNPGRWLFRWRVENKTETAMHLLSVRVPHGRFKAEERKFEPVLKIAAQDHFILKVDIACREPPNTIIENAFLILLLNWQENQWRFFVRLQITIDQRGRPAATTESITVQQVGFSGISN